MATKEILNILLGIAGMLLLILIHLMDMDALVTDIIGIMLFILICHRYHIASKNSSENNA